jgi:hypothetical protein
MFIDENRSRVHDEIHRQDNKLFAHILTPELFWQAALKCGLSIICSPLNLINLVWLAISAARNPKKAFAALLDLPLESLQDQQSFPDSDLRHLIDDAKQKRRDKSNRRRQAKRCAKANRRAKASRAAIKANRAATANPTATPGNHNPHPSEPEHVSEQAFTKARQSMPTEFWVALFILLAERFDLLYAAVIRWRHFRLLAVDGTRINLPDYPALRQHFGTAKNSTGSHNAQAQMVLVQFPLARLPYAYAVDSVEVGEVTLARRLLQGLRVEDLVLLDAGYLSYGLLWQIHYQGANFVVRLHRRLNMKIIKELGPGDELVRWQPKDSRGNWRKEELPKAITLRRLTYQPRGFRSMQLLTNVLSEQEVSHKEFWDLSVSEQGEVLTKGLYNWRWEIETTYRELKVEQQLEGNLRSRTPAGIEYEIAGHVLYYLLVRWLMVEAAVAAAVSPLRLSFKAALAEVERLWTTARSSREQWVREGLLPRLRQGLACHRVGERPLRQYPRAKKERRASKSQANKQYKSKQAKKAKSGQKKTKQRQWYGQGWDLGGPKPQPDATGQGWFGDDWDLNSPKP